MEKYWRRTGGMLFLAALLGAASGLVAVLFHGALQYLQIHILGDLMGVAAYGGSIPRLPRWLFFAVPALGGLASGTLVYLLAPDAAGAGTDALIDAFHNRGGRVSWRVTVVKFFSSLLTLGTGGSAGQEGPIAQIGGGLGSLVGKVTGLPSRHRRLLLLTGTAGGLGAIFRAPLGGALTAAEIVYKEDFESQGFLPFIVSSVVGFTVFTLITHQTHAYLHFPVFPFTHVGELLVYTLVGLVCVPFSWAFVRLYRGIRELSARKTFIPNFCKPAIGGLLVGLVAYACPEALSTGWNYLTDSVAGRYGFAALLFIGLAKIVTTSLTIGSGGSGGVFGPCLFIGGMVGGAVGFGLHGINPEWVSNPGSYVLVGMGAFFAGAAKAPLAGQIMVCEITGNYGLLPPLLLASTVHLVLSRGWTIYDSQRHDKFASPAHADALKGDVLRQSLVEDIFSPATFVMLAGGEKPAEAAARVGDGDEEVFPIIDADGRLKGMISRDILRRAALDREALPLLVLEDLATRARSLRPTMDLHTALAIFLESDASQIPVVDDEGRPLGLLRLHEIMREYDRLTQSRP